MKVSSTKLGRLFGIAAVGVGLIGAAGCGDNPVTKACGLECPTDASGASYGVAEGNASISGYAPIDGFFQSVVNFKGVAAGVTANIKAELDGIQAAFGISDAELKAKGSLDAAIAAKLQADFKAKLVVKAQPAECKVDAKITAQASAECKAKAECDVQVDPGKASVMCMGKCTVEASVEGKCDANADVKCEVTGPSVECSGSCEGTCTAELTAAASCSGTCNGTCDGTCMGDTDQGAGCNGQCMGMCKGTCELSGMAALDCKGKCEGSCKATPPSGMCSADAKVSCELKADAMAQCSGSCDGEFEPPKAMGECKAEASCDASAKADAKFNASCTPPSIDIRVESTASINAEAQAKLDFAISELKARLPRLLASLKKAEIVAAAGGDLAASASGAIKGTIDGLADGNVDVVAAFRIGKCVPSQLDASASVITMASADLKAQIEAAGKVTKSVGMGS